MGSKLTHLCTDWDRSEWAKDQSHHTKERLAETKVINSSLYTLKRCLRLKIAQDEQLTTNSTGSVPPVRESQITRLLSPVFLDRGARLVRTRDWAV